MKFTGFYKKQVFMYLFKTRKECFLKAFENRHGTLLRFLCSSHLKSSMEKMFLRISQNSQENTCIRVSILINLHVPSLQLYRKKLPRHRCFPVNSANFQDHLFFQNTSEQLLLNFAKENEASENRISNRWFYLFWSFIYKSYCIVTNISLQINVAYNSVWLNCIHLRSVFSHLWAISTVCDSSVTRL